MSVLGNDLLTPQAVLRGKHSTVIEEVAHGGKSISHLGGFSCDNTKIKLRQFTGIRCRT